MVVAARQAGDKNSSRADGPTSGLTKVHEYPLWYSYVF